MAGESNAAKLASGSDAAEVEGWKVVDVDEDGSNAAKLVFGSFLVLCVALLCIASAFCSASDCFAFLFL